MRRILLTTLVLFAATSCSATDPASPETTTSTSPPTTVATTTQPPSDDPALSSSPCLAGDRPFASAGVISAFGGTSGDATQISAIRWADHPGCERVVIDLLTADGAPAGTSGPVGVDFDETLGIIRINLPASITRTAVADSRLDGEFVDSTYVVRTDVGRMAVDVHIRPGAAVSLRAFEVSNPSRIVVDVKPDDVANPVLGVARAGDLVVLSPTPGSTDSPILVTGYTRSFEALVVASLHADADSPAITEQSSLASDWSEMWGEFEIQFVDPPQQEMSLFVGTDSPTSGDAGGLWLDIDTTSPTDTNPPDA